MNECATPAVWALEAWSVVMGKGTATDRKSWIIGLLHNAGHLMAQYMGSLSIEVPSHQLT